MFTKVKQEAHGPHHLPEFQTINTIAQSYDYTITLIKNEKPIISILRIKIAIYLQKHASPLLKDAFYRLWLKLAAWSRRKRFYNFVSVCSLLRYRLPLEEGGFLHLNKIASTTSSIFFLFGYIWLSFYEVSQNWLHVPVIVNTPTMLPMFLPASITFSLFVSPLVRRAAHNPMTRMMM